jgi:hypothetical protein
VNNPLRHLTALLAVVCLAMQVAPTRAQAQVLAHDERAQELQRAYARNKLWGPRLTIATGAGLFIASGLTLAFAASVQSGDCGPPPCDSGPPRALLAILGGGMGTGALMVGLGVPWLVHRRRARRAIAHELDALRTPGVVLQRGGAYLTWSARF